MMKNFFFPIIFAFLTTLTLSEEETPQFPIIFIAATLSIMYFIKNHFSKQKDTRYVPHHRLRFQKDSPENPAGNILPYQDFQGSRRSPPSTAKIRANILKRIPVPPHDKIFNQKFGLRETLPVDNIPDKAGFSDYLYNGMTSCKDDRMSCLPVANKAISSGSFSV